MGPLPKERRRHPRINERLSLEICTEEGVRFTATSINISAGGVYFQVHRLIAANPTGRITVQLPEGEKVCCKLELVRTEPAREICEHCWAGRFSELEGDGRVKIDRYIESAAKRIGNRP